MKLLMIALGLAACGGGLKRSQIQYRSDTQQLLATRTADIEACYAKTLSTDANAGGLVTVKFTVEKQSGSVGHATIDQLHTTAPEPVMTCVLSAIAGLILQPPDRNDGHATFAYELRPAS